MVAPTIGPVSQYRTNNFNGAGSFAIDQRRYKQKPPFDLMLPYYQVTKRVLSAKGVARVNGVLVDTIQFASANANVGYGPWQQFTYAANSSTFEVVEALQLARSRFASKVSEQASILVNIAERQQTKKMVMERFGRYYKAFNAFRKGDYYRARTSLRAPLAKTPTPPLRNRAKNVGNNWLEWHFGWEPLIKDIHQGMEILVAPIPSLTAIGKGRCTNNWSFRTYSGPNNGGYNCKHVDIANATVRAHVFIQNKNLWMANQLGLLNPALVAWEVVPFSFLVDWFVNIGDFVAQFNEFTGVELRDQLTSWKFVDTTTSHYEDWYTQTQLTSRWDVTSQAISSERMLGIPAVKLRVKIPDRLSWQRGLTSVALLLQALKSH